MVAPFLLGFGTAATVITVAIGAAADRAWRCRPREPVGAVPLSAHAGFDYTLAATATTPASSIGAITGDGPQASFLVGIGAALAALTASTRFSAARGA